MASIALGALGTALGAGFGGITLFGTAITGSMIGGMIGTAIGGVVDSWILMSLQPTQRHEGARLDSLRMTSSTEGVTIPRLFGVTRVGGNIIWATDFREEVNTTKQGGKGGGGGGVETTEYTYYASFAVAVGEGPIGGIGRIWADGDLLDTTAHEWRWYPGDETQMPDPFIEGMMGADSTPAYRGTAYVVFEDMLLTEFGNRIPQLTFEVFRPLPDADTAEGLVQAVTLIPATGEFAYGTTTVDAEDEHINENAIKGRPDALVALDALAALAPEVKSVSLVVSWFGNDLRAGECEIKPGVEQASRDTSVTWRVNGVDRANAHVVSQIGGGPAYGGTPSDSTIVQIIQELKSRGYRVTFYPFILMDIPADNTLPNPYSNSALDVGQPAHPWRGRITCSPAAGYDASPDKLTAAGFQVVDFFGLADPSDFDVDGTTVSWTGGSDWGFRRMVLHYAHLCDAAGGVDAFLIGSELRGLTQVRSGASIYPAVTQLKSLAADVRSIVGGGTKISYAADWSEYFGHHPQDGSGDVYFHLDPLWSDANVDFVGIDNYMALSDWRDGWDHLDAEAGAPSIYDRAYLQSNIEGGEGFDWYYASDGDRAAQVRTPITDGAHGKPWVFRYKDIRSWWSSEHYNRPGGVESVSPTDWVPESKPIWFTELGCPAIDRGTNQPNVFVDPKSSESFVPYFSRGWRDDRIQRAYLEAVYSWWRDGDNNPISNVYSEPMVSTGESAAWTWDIRPYPFFPNLTGVWADGENWRLGHWLTGRLGSVSLAALVRHLCLSAGMQESDIDVSGLTGMVEGLALAGIESPKTTISMLAQHFGFDACESQGVIRFRDRGAGPVARLTEADLVAASGDSDVVELVRAQETELPQALRWQVTRNDDEFDSIVVEARRTTVDSARIASETFAVAVPPEEADRRVHRALWEAWASRETATFMLPPSRIALDPADVVTLEHDGRDYDLRITSVSDSLQRGVETVRHDREVYDLPPGQMRSTSTRRVTFFPPPTVLFMNLPQLAATYAASAPVLAARGSPWPGEMAVYRSDAGADDFSLVRTFNRSATIGTLAGDFYAGPVDRFDMANELYVDLAGGPLVSISDAALFAGGNALAIETDPGVWEIVQAGDVTLLSPGSYRLQKLIRGVRGTEWAMRPVVSSGATVVLLDEAIVPLEIDATQIGIPGDWRVGPAQAPVDASSYKQAAFTPSGMGVESFSGAHVRQPWRHGREAGDLTISWIRRSRNLAADIWGSGDVPLDEGAEVYEVDIMDGGTVKRTLYGFGAPSVTYTAAQQTADWGTVLSPGGSLDIRIYQVAPVVGRGIPLVETLNI